MHDILMKWIKENEKYSFVQEFYIMYSQAYEAQEMINNGTVPSKPMSLIDMVSDSVKYRYICCAEQYKTVSIAIRDRYFKKNWGKFNKYFKARLGEYSLKNDEILKVRNLFAHANNFHDVDILPYDSKEIIINFLWISVIYDLYIDFLKKKSNNYFIGQILC
ncbi:hypothetical protein [Rummeliibacillus pycnus]|uniref:hypothetical protein n=1 Tax=Rummeliibacillus pycnus TaxID=101070 RepID=UPI000C99BB12|nr:hypothetical protein [Rummeliibacillus pycnus]